jgi:hypothetical protein
MEIRQKDQGRGEDRLLIAEAPPGTDRGIRWDSLTRHLAFTWQSLARHWAPAAHVTSRYKPLQGRTLRSTAPHVAPNWLQRRVYKREPPAQSPRCPPPTLAPLGRNARQTALSQIPPLPLQGVTDRYKPTPRGQPPPHDSTPYPHLTAKNKVRGGLPSPPHLHEQTTATRSGRRSRPAQGEGQFTTSQPPEATAPGGCPLWNLEARYFSAFRTRSATSHGSDATWAPAAVRASTFDWKVPRLPSMMAPAWPIRLPAGAALPAR